MAADLQARLRRVTSRQNALVKQLRRAFDRGQLTEEGSCAIESLRIVEEAIRSGLRFRALFLAESTAEERATRLLPQISAHVEALVLPDEVFASAVETEAPQGVAALVQVKPHSLDEVLQHPAPLLVAAAGIQDPGNMGTIIRSAEAFGATGVLVGEKTVSPFNAKAVRAAAGSLFRLPVVQVEFTAVLPELQKRELFLIATSSHKGTPLDRASPQLSGPLVLFIGNEGAGLPREITSQIDAVVAIPHSPRVESLNAGVAASIVLYEIARHRKTADRA
jgi:TrmH family RNA methyltransferase